LYASALTVTQKRAHKQEAFGQLKYDYGLLKASWNGYSGYDRWFDRTLNNAHLMSAATYHGCMPGFRRVLESVNGDLPSFYAEVRKLAAESKEVREETLCEGEEAAD
jgi:predicted aminopeptidase